MSNPMNNNIGSIIYKTTHDHRKGFGTGILISSNLVLTCAHNVYDKKYSKTNYEIEFYHGLCG